MYGIRVPQEGVPLRVVLFSGGRGSATLAKQLLRDRRVDLTLAINGYDDGASTGEVRRFLGDSLGPSDFRKNASHIARELRSCPEALVRVLDERLAVGIDTHVALARLTGCSNDRPELAPFISAFVEAYAASDRSFRFGDCAIGNLVFAGAYLRAGRDFNRAVDSYCALLGLPPGQVENVTTGENGYLVALADDGRVVASEAALVNGHPSSIRDLFVVARPLDPCELAAIEALSPDERLAELTARHVPPTMNPRLGAKLAQADLVVYAPGTQHSSLFPSYLTAGVGDAIAANVRAIKLLITNIQSDVEIAGADAITLIRKASFYLTRRGTESLPTPLLFTHCLVNDPGSAEAERPCVPLGPIDTVEDPRLIRIGQFEDGVTGRHDAARLLRPIIDSLTPTVARLRVAVVLERASSASLLTQTLLELARGGLGDLPFDSLVLYEGAPLPASLTAALPFTAQSVETAHGLREAVDAHHADYVAVLDSSGMYRGEDLVSLMSQLRASRLDAVWGSRRLSLRDIEVSVTMRYARTPLAAWVSRVGSEVLSLACLAVHGRYISDTLSGIRVYRAADLESVSVPLTDAMANHQVLASLLSRRAEVIEMPVHFLPRAPGRVRRTTTWDGLRALATLVRAPRAGRPGVATRAPRRRDIPRELMVQGRS